MADGKVVIDIIAPNVRTFNMLEFVLQQQGKGRFELGRGNRPDLVVADFDKSDAKAAFRKYRSRFPGIPAVLLLDQPEEYEALHAEDRIGAEFVLLKPFAAKDFIAKINECLGEGPAQPVRPATPGVKEATLVGAKSTQGASPAAKAKLVPETARKSAAAPERTLTLQTSATGNQTLKPGPRPRAWAALENEQIAYSFAFESEIDMADAAAVQALWLKIDRRLLGHLKNAIARWSTGQPAFSLAISSRWTLHVSPATRTVAIVGDGFDLLGLARQDLDGAQIVLSESAMPTSNIQLQLGLEDFLWKLALYTYRGYLPEGVDVNKPCYLKYWPNLTRLEPTPDAMRIAALWSRQPVAPAFIVRILNIPQRHVFNFYAAANAIAYAGPAVREVDNMLLPAYPEESGYALAQGFVDITVALEQKAI